MVSLLTPKECSHTEVNYTHFYEKQYIKTKKQKKNIYENKKKKL